MFNEISPERRKFIVDLASEEGLDPGLGDAEYYALCEMHERELDRFFASACTAEELHIFAGNWNWDAGTKRLHQLIDHPSCDAATALMIYWIAEPEYYLQYSNAAEIPYYNRDGFDLIVEIEERYLASAFPSGDLSFDPAEYVGLHESIKQKFKSSLPEKMYKPIIAGATNDRNNV